MEIDYRQSHRGVRKAESYDLQFSRNAYRAMLWRLEQDILGSVVDRLVPRGANHLDFACGTGRILAFLSPRVGASTGVDVSEEMLDVARRRCPGCTLVAGDLTGIAPPLADRSYDLVTAFRFFPNAQDDLRLAAMRALRSRLAPNGVLVFNNHKHRSSVLYRIGRLLRRSQRDMSSRDVEALIAKCDLEVVETHHQGVVPASERFRFLPVAVIEFAERLLSRVAPLRTLATDVIYVCRARGSRR